MLIPYPETKAQWIDRTKGTFAIRTPWIEINAEIDPQEAVPLQRALDSVNNFHLGPSPAQAKEAHYLLEQFSEHPIAYSRPRPLGKFSPPPVNSSRLAELNSVLAQLPSPPLWDHEAILNRCRIEHTDLFDAVSVIGCLRRHRLVDTAANKHIQKQVADLGQLKNLDRPLFLSIMRRVLEHSLYITRSAVPSLEGALGLLDAADKLLKDFIRSETGHDILVSKSLKALGGYHTDLENHLLEEVLILVRTLRMSASLSLLTLAGLIEGFEGVSYDEEPNNIWHLLDNIEEFPKAARGVREHQRINDQHHHADICIQLAALLAPVTREEAQLALRIAEGSESLRTRLFEKLYSSIGL